MQLIEEALAGLKLGAPQIHLNLALFPLLADYGRISYVGHGCDIVFFDKKARARLAKEKLDAALEAERLCGTYAILGADGAVVAVGHRYGCIPRG